MTLQNILTTSKTGYPSASSESSNKEAKQNLLANLVRNILVEIGGVALLSKATYSYTVPFSTASFIPHLALGIVIANTVCKCIGWYLQYQELEYQAKTPEYPRSSLDKCKTIAQWLPPLNFAFFFGATGNLLIHETGHISAAALVYKGLKAQITIPGLFRGAVSWTKNGFTALGSSLGGLNSRLLVCVAGPLMAVLAGTVVLVAGIHLRDRFPELSKYLTTTALFTIAFQVLYALSALWASEADLSHDFVMLRHVGVNPIVASLLLASIPLIAVAAYFRLRKTRSE